MTRLLITGGSSYLGRHLVPIAEVNHEVGYTYYLNRPLGTQGISGELRGTQEEEKRWGRKTWQLDLRDEAAVRQLVTEWQPEVIIHLAGSNRSPDMTAVIEQGASHLVAAATLVNARLIHFSSDVVFDGRHAPYRESDPPSPIHAYGRAKAAAEAIVARYPNHVIIRTSLIYGRRLMDRSTEWIATALSQGQPVTLFDNQWRNPVWARTLSLASLELAQMEFRGILHIAGRQAMTRADFGLKLLDWWGIAGRDSLTIGPSSDAWPLDCRLDIALATELLETPLLGVDEVLAEPGETTQLNRKKMPHG
jgi:dTDP-4-dehydrorhamnose reductase